MTVEIRTRGVKPIRNTFGHLARRFGDKRSTRYQEIAYDTQSEANFHYKPLWDPEREIYDKGRTAVVMKDWYALKDPRQFYYGSYTTRRAKQQETLDGQLDFVRSRDLLRKLPESTRKDIGFALVPLRHYEWGANRNNCHVAAYGWGTTITQAAIMATTDRLGMAQHLSRIGLLLDGSTGDSLAHAKRLWTGDAAWQPLRAAVEHLFVTRDWFEVLVAQDLVADALVYPLFYRHFDDRIAATHGPALSSLTSFLSAWWEESTPWIDGVVRTAVSESQENRVLVDGWTRKWSATFRDALAPLATAILGDAGSSALAATHEDLLKRTAKIGLPTGAQ